MGAKGKFRSPAAVIIFTIITCGIYGLIWMYNFAKELKIYLEKEDLNPGLDLFLSIICVPYIIYWSYKYGKVIYEAQQKAGISPADDNSILYLILTILGLFIVNMAIMQSSANKIWTKS